MSPSPAETLHQCEMSTPLYPIFRKRINDAFEQLIRQQVTPWVFIKAGPPFRINRFDGRQIAYEGIEFIGTPEAVFWSRYIEPFIENLCISEIDTAVEMAKQRDVNAKLLLPEIQDLLTTGITKVYENMADIDRRLRGKGYPETIPRRSVTFEIDRMETFCKERIQAELDMWQARESSMQNAPFQAIDLLENQKQIFLELVKADQSVPTKDQGRFIVSETMNSPPSVLHVGISERLVVGKGDLDSLSDGNLLRLVRKQGTQTFHITPFGFRYAEWLRGHMGEPLLRVSEDVRSYLGSSNFKTQYKVAFQKWTQAEAALWGDDSANQLTTIGHLCREVLQDFCTVLVEKYTPKNVNTDKAKIVSRLKSVFECFHPALRQNVKGLLDALVVYWGSLIDLVQRQEHGGTKEGEPLTWEDAQRVVFHTAVVMWEIDRALSKTQNH